MGETLFDQTPHEMIDVGHSKVPYWRAGAGPDLFFVHGWPLHAATFRGLLPHLEGQYTCHFIDLPGTGQSEWGRESKIGLMAHAETVLAVIEHLGLERFGLLGFDSGAAIARVVAARHGDSVFGVVMGNTEIPGHTPFMLTVLTTLGKLPGAGAMMHGVLSSRLMRRTSLGFKGCFNDLDYIDGEFTARFVEPLVKDKRALLGQMLLANGLKDGLLANLEQTHSEITAPTLMIWGTRDPWFPLKHARGMMDQFAGGAELVEIEGGKLFVHEEFADTFAHHALAFLERQRARRAA